MDIENDFQTESKNNISLENNISNDADSYNQKNKKKTNNKKNTSKKNSVDINLDKNIIDDVLKTNGKANIKIISPYNNLETTYTYKYKSKNIYFYQCNKRPNCKGKARFNRLDLSFRITKKCTNIEEHNKLNYNRFKELLDTNQSNLIDFNIPLNPLSSLPAFSSY